MKRRRWPRAKLHAARPSRWSARRFAIVGAAVISATHPARADRLEGVSLFPAAGAYRLGTELEGAAFRNAGRRGSYGSVVARAEWFPVDGIGVRLRVPFTTLALEGEPATREGFGDSELRFRATFYNTDPFRVSAGWVTELPTGARHRGIGNGSVQVSPFVTAGYRIRHLVVYGTVADSISVAGRDQTRFPNYVDPGTDHELRVTAGTIYAFDETISGALAITDTIILTEADRGHQLYVANALIGAQRGPLRLVISPSVPIAGDQRFSWRITTAALLSF
jgi:hypothetical protein